MHTTLENPSADAKKTMELLWSRVRQRGDLPGFSKVVSAIISAMHGDDDQEFNMTRTVLQDPALTQRVLRLANSAMYSVFGQDINTVSKAVIVLGTEAIGHLALGLKLIDGLSQASAQSTSARAEMEKAVLAGHIARQVASSASSRDAEEAVVCSMLHTLGRMMATFYLSDKWQRVQEICADEQTSEDEAARREFGLGLDDIGRQIAQQWGFPQGLVNTLTDTPPKPAEEPVNHADWLGAVSTLSSRCASVLCSESVEVSNQVADLAADYASMLGMDASQVLSAVDAATRAAEEDDTIGLKTFSRNRPASGEVQPSVQIDLPESGLPVLSRGVGDMRSAVQSGSPMQLLTMALETIYQGLNLGRAITFLRNQEQGQYTARMCLGEGLQELLPQLAFGDAYEPNVFHAALANDKMIYVENPEDPAFVNKLPGWWRRHLPAVRSFMVLPLTINRQPIGFLYADWGSLQPVVKIEQEEIALLNELRQLVVRAVERRRQLEPGWARRMS